MKDNSGNKDLLIERIVEIAHNLDGKNEDMFEQTGDRLRDALGRISNWFEEYKMGSAKELPDASELSDGELLSVKDGCWLPRSPLFTVRIDDGTMEADCTNQDILDAMEDGVQVVLIYGELAAFVIAGANVGETGLFQGIGIMNGENVGSIASLAPETTDADNVRWEKHEYPLKKSPLHVTLTPTAADMSGTMDHTPQELSEAYDDGREIIFGIENPAFDWMHLKPSLVSKTPHRDYYCFQANIIDWTQSTPVLINIWTNDDSNSTYSTHIYALTEV